MLFIRCHRQDYFGVAFIDLNFLSLLLLSTVSSSCRLPFEEEWIISFIHCCVAVFFVSSRVVSILLVIWIAFTVLFNQQNSLLCPRLAMDAWCMIISRLCEINRLPSLRLVVNAVRKIKMLHVFAYIHGKQKLYARSTTRMCSMVFFSGFCGRENWTACYGSRIECLSRTVLEDQGEAIAIGKDYSFHSQGSV